MAAIYFPIDGASDGRIKRCGDGLSRPGKPMAQVLIESFNRRFREEYLNIH
ncbi:integrase core domain-containing protein [Brenneria izbisi]|uniref:integrase core domain-containing protein n=1 Tax=Brenneria izbisi TaxID=2939450 RepID=UPI00384E4C43